MIDIRPLQEISAADLHRLIKGYDSDFKFAVEKSESGDEFLFTLKRVPLPKPYHKRFDHVDAGTVGRYQQMAALGFSFGAFDDESCVGIALCEPSLWNRSLWVRELHAAPSHQRRGIGRKLLSAVGEKARAARLRTVVCETQNTNGPAIQFYREVGFQLEGFDLSLYRNDDFPDGEIALFMKMRIESGSAGGPPAFPEQNL
ncbi:MAG: putative GCN5-related N-acetyltransferase [Verrucomicrobia bacterium]|nr:putative GCN5-related N-acetyltransferase [Verrucomicrobiota bacterium]